MKHGQHKSSTQWYYVQVFRMSDGMKGPSNGSHMVTKCIAETTVSFGTVHILTTTTIYIEGLENRRKYIIQ